MNPTPSLVIHELLPSEMMGVIFEEHAKLEWMAPAIDGQVCRFWREIVLNTPRAWSYIEIRYGCHPSMGELRLWLRRSGTAPLHIDCHSEILYGILSYHHTRIVSLQATNGSKSIFEGRDFPRMQHLSISHWYPFQWGSMPKLQSLRLYTARRCVVPLRGLPPLKMLTLACFQCTSVLWHSQSLTTLMLYDMSLVDVISGPVTFPSLTYLSLYNVRDLKPHINAPCLVTYHESGSTVDESFYIPLPSLVEYGVSYLSTSSLDPAEWHLYFPNILRVSLRARQDVLLSFLAFLANHPQSFPALRTICAPVVGYYLPEKIYKNMESLVLARNEVCDVHVVLPLEKTGPPFCIPIFFARVCDLSIRRSCDLLMHILGTGRWSLKTFRSRVLTCSLSPPKL